MNTLLSMLIGVIIGVLLTGTVGWVSAPMLMLNEYKSPYGVEKTVEVIKNNARSADWVVPGVFYTQVD